MIDRQGTKIIFHCDSDRCTEFFEGDEHEPFGEVWLRAKEQGWRTRLIANEWLHGCPSCGAPT